MRGQTSGHLFDRFRDFAKDAERLALSRAMPLGMGLLRESSGNFALMVVVDWAELQALRSRYDLQPNYPHITVAFRDYDIHDQPKDVTALIQY